MGQRRVQFEIAAGLPFAGQHAGTHPASLDSQFAAGVLEKEVAGNELDTVVLVPCACLPLRIGNSETQSSTTACGV